MRWAGGVIVGGCLGFALFRLVVIRLWCRMVARAIKQN
jgi:hypothetical protein